ncbi:MAG: tripartite tricarboxylate transporter substrate-binding protein [Deferrisomatales bacterium]|nr:tripartite tricarboxylate transporter substrate-binding protein [Deferrisomatales bacterium]
MRSRPTGFMLWSCVLVLALSFSMSSATAADAAWKPEKPITIIIPVSVGGGYDMYVRMMAPFLSEELDTQIRIKNQPGGAWMIGLKQIYEAKPDGYTIGIWNPGVLINDKDILGKADFDMTTYTFLYRITDEPRVVIAKADGPIADFKDLLAKGKDPNFQLRNSYSGGTALLDAKLMDSEWGINSEKIAYSSGSKTRLAVMRGDTHFCVSGLGSGMDALPSGRVKFILLLNDKHMSDVPEAKGWMKDYPELKDLPIPSDLGLPELSYNSKSARAFIAPPGLPKEIKDTLEAAMAKCVANEDLRQIGLKSDRPFGEGQGGDEYLAKMQKDKAALIKAKDMLKE